MNFETGKATIDGKTLSSINVAALPELDLNPKLQVNHKEIRKILFKRF